MSINIKETSRQVQLLRQVEVEGKKDQQPVCTFTRPAQYSSAEPANYLAAEQLADLSLAERIGLKTWLQSKLAEEAAKSAQVAAGERAEVLLGAAEFLRKLNAALTEDADQLVATDWAEINAELAGLNRHAKAAAKAVRPSKNIAGATA